MPKVAKRPSRARVRSVAVAMLCGFAMATPAPAHAAAKKKKASAAAPAAKAHGSAAAEAEAKKLFAEGNLLFDSGQFDRALAVFTAAYEKFPVPGILVNIAQCHRNLGNYERAIFFYRKFLAESPDSAMKDAVVDVIREMEEKGAAAKREAEASLAAGKAAAEATAESERKVRAELEAAAAVDAARAARLAAEAAATRLKTVRESRPFYQRAWFWAVVGGALLAAGGATTAGLLLSRGGPPESSLGRWDCRPCEL